MPCKYPTGAINIENTSSLRNPERQKKHLPETAKLNKRTFAKYLNKYSDIIIKPIDGSRGRGVLRVSKKSENEYELHVEEIKKTVEGTEQLCDEVKTHIGNHIHIVQRRIPLSTVNGRPFDIRVIVQRKSLTKSWKVTGKVAKVAGQGYIVTNITRSVGSVLPLKTAIRKSSIKLSRKVTISKIDKVARRAASRLSKLYMEQYIFGFDMGVDKNGHVWIIEANLSPMLSHFKKLAGKKLYRRILKNKQAAEKNKNDLNHLINPLKEPSSD